MGEAGRYMGLLPGRMDGCAAGRFGGRFGRSVVEKSIIEDEGWQPTDLANILFWVRSDKGIILNGSNVSQWSDQSSNNNNYIQANAVFQMEYQLNKINGKPALWSYLKYMDMTFTTPVNMPITIFSVYKMENSNLINALFDGFTSNHRIAAYWYQDNNLYMSGNSGQFPYSKTIPFSNYIINTHIFSNNGGSVYENGVLKNSGSFSADYLDGIRLGSLFDLGYRFVGNIAEQVAYNGVLSASDRAMVETYLNSKYALYE